MSSVEELTRRVSDLENENIKLRSEVTRAIGFISNHFSTELQKVMDDYRESLKAEVIKLINSYKQQ
jgi:hypothetical protein